MHHNQTKILPSKSTIPTRRYFKRSQSLFSNQISTENPSFNRLPQLSTTLACSYTLSAILPKASKMQRRPVAPSRTRSSSRLSPPHSMRILRQVAPIGPERSGYESEILRFTRSRRSLWLFLGRRSVPRIQYKGSSGTATFWQHCLS